MINYVMWTNTIHGAAIKEMKPVDVHQTVYWIDYDDDYGAYCCSVCEQNAPEDTEWPYFPHCGADMREADNGKET